MHKPGEPSEDFVKHINFHVGHRIPFFYKYDRDMPNTFVKKVKHDLEDPLELNHYNYYKRDLSEDCITDLIKASWKEWTSPPSPSRYAERTVPFLDSLDVEEFEQISKFAMFRELIAGLDEGVLDPEQDLTDFVKAVNFHTRRHVPIIYKDSRDIPHSFIKKVIASVTVYYAIYEVDEDYISEFVKQGWRHHRNELRRKYIKNKDPATVKVSSPSPFVSGEDWVKFVDMSTSTEYQAICARNVVNRRKAYVSDDCIVSFSYLQVKLAKERDFNNDAMLDGTETEISSHVKTKKQKTIQFS
ncbi:hypothetical protein ACHQM5_013557 [Ranunculus cassubicifolius]